MHAQIYFVNNHLHVLLYVPYCHKSYLFYATTIMQQFAQKDEWSVLCNSLASRLMTVGNTPAATLCYICAGNIERTVEIWSHCLKPDCDGRTYIDLLQVTSLSHKLNCHS